MSGDGTAEITYTVQWLNGYNDENMQPLPLQVITEGSKHD